MTKVKDGWDYMRYKAAGLGIKLTLHKGDDTTFAHIESMEGYYTIEETLTFLFGVEYASSRKSLIPVRVQYLCKQYRLGVSIKRLAQVEGMCTKRLSKVLKLAGAEIRRGVKDDESIDLDLGECASYGQRP